MERQGVMLYTTVTVGLVAGQEAEGINTAIAQGCNNLLEEVGGPVELVSVCLMPISGGACVTVLAKPYQPPIKFAGTHSIEDVLKQALMNRDFRGAI